MLNVPSLTYCRALLALALLGALGGVGSDEARDHTAVLVRVEAVHQVGRIDVRGDWVKKEKKR